MDLSLFIHTSLLEYQLLYLHLEFLLRCWLLAVNKDKYTKLFRWF
jgi:hypothetical protein